MAIKVLRPWRCDDENIGRFRAEPQALADQRIDLLSVVVHELGHMMGLDSQPGTRRRMSETIVPGERRLPPMITVTPFAAIDDSQDDHRRDRTARYRQPPQPRIFE